MNRIANDSAANLHSKRWYILAAVVLLATVLVGCYFFFFASSTPTESHKSVLETSPSAEQKPKNTSHSRVKPVMNVPDIMTGHYETIAGTWVNAADDRLIIDGDSMTWKVANSRITINRFSLTPKYAKSPIIGTVTRNNFSASITWNAPAINGFSHSYSLSFYPDGTKILGNDSTPLDKFYDGERIVALPGNATERYWADNQNIEPFIYYRVNDQERIAAVREATANLPVMHNITCTAPTPHAFPCAGSPAPENTLEIPEIFRSENITVAGLIFPAQDTYCDFTVDGTNPATLECMVMSWSPNNPKSPVTFPPPDPVIPGGPTVHFYDGDIPKFEGHRSDTMASQNSGLPDTGIGNSLELEPGQTATYRNWVCSGQPQALTCWNSLTGHGAVFGEAIFETF